MSTDIHLLNFSHNNGLIKHIGGLVVHGNTDNCAEINWPSFQSWPARYVQTHSLLVHITALSIANVRTNFKAKQFLFQRHGIFQNLSSYCTDAPSCRLGYKTEQFPTTRFLIFYYLLLSVRSVCIMQRTFGTEEMICCRHSGLLPPGQVV